MSSSGALCCLSSEQGQAKVQHKPPMLDDDLKKLYESGVFNSDHSKTLLNKVFFEIMLCFCRRGRQNLRQLKKAGFEVHTDATGAKFVSKVRDELTNKKSQRRRWSRGRRSYVCYWTRVVPWRFFREMFRASKPYQSRPMVNTWIK